MPKIYLNLTETQIPSFGTCLPHMTGRNALLRQISTCGKTTPPSTVCFRFLTVWCCWSLCFSMCEHRYVAGRKFGEPSDGNQYTQCGAATHDAKGPRTKGHNNFTSHSFLLRPGWSQDSQLLREPPGSA